MKAVGLGIILALCCVCESKADGPEKTVIVIKLPRGVPGWFSGKVKNVDDIKVEMSKSGSNLAAPADSSKDTTGGGQDSAKDVANGPDDGRDPAVKISNVNQVDLAVFFSQYEDTSYIAGTEFAERYLTNPELMQTQTGLITELVRHVQNRQRPVSLEQFYRMALSRTRDPGTALMVAHNVTKALARGRSPIPWSKESVSPLVYTLDGQRIEFDPSSFHSDAEPEANGVPSVFYAMFDHGDLNTDDPGDVYHFYLNAIASYYAAAGELDFNNASSFNPFNYSRVVDSAIDDSMQQMSDAEASDAYDGWRFANALSYLEGAKYGQDFGGGQESLNRESNIHRQGALFGLNVAGVEPDPSWRWYVPKIGSAAGSFDTSVDLVEDTFAVLDPLGREISASPANAASGVQNDNSGTDSRRD